MTSLTRCSQERIWSHNHRKRILLYLPTLALLCSMMMMTPLFLFVRGQGATTRAPRAIQCTQNGYFKAITAAEKIECHNCDFYVCLFYPSQKIWYVLPRNCSKQLGGNRIYVYSFDNSAKKCILNETATAAG